MRRILLFVAVTFLFTTLVTLPLILNKQLGMSIPTIPYQHFLASFGPLVGAITIAVKYKNFRLLPQYNLKFGRSGWLWGVAFPFSLGLFGYIIYCVQNSKVMSLNGLGSSEFLSINPILILLVWLFTYGLGEESGWRGFLLPELNKRFNLFVSTLITGMIWAAWHIPMFFYHQPFMEMGATAIGWVFGLISGSIVLGYVYKKSNNLLIPVIMWHAIFNFFASSNYGGGILAVVTSIFVILISMLVPLIERNLFFGRKAE